MLRERCCTALEIPNIFLVTPGVRIETTYIHIYVSELKEGCMSSLLGVALVLEIRRIKAYS